MRYKVYCETDSKWEWKSALNPKEECPVNAAHTVRAGSLSIEGECPNKDYKKLRSEFATYVATETFTALSTAEKELASKHFVVVKADRDTVHTDAEQEANGEVYHENSCKSRDTRATRAEALVYNRLVTVDANNVIADLQAENLITSYIRFGVEGTTEGDNEGIYDYIDGTTGTRYVSGGALPGLAHKGFTPISGTLAGLVTELLDILKGNDQ